MRSIFSFILLGLFHISIVSHTIVLLLVLFRAIWDHENYFVSKHKLVVGQSSFTVWMHANWPILVHSNVYIQFSMANDFRLLHSAKARTTMETDAHRCSVICGFIKTHLGSWILCACACTESECRIIDNTKRWTQEHVSIQWLKLH